MGCDYYIVKQLKIDFEDGDNYETIELNREREYFPDNVYNDIDSDDSDYEERLNKQYDEYLKVYYKPIVIYCNGAWKNEKIKNKYEKLVLEFCKNKKINTIIKEEQRYLR